jgi:hypothetical protein
MQHQTNLIDALSILSGSTLWLLGSRAIVVQSDIETIVITAGIAIVSLAFCV